MDKIISRVGEIIGRRPGYKYARIPLDDSSREREVDAFKKKGVESLRLKEKAEHNVDRKARRLWSQGQVENREEKIESTWISLLTDTTLKQGESISHTRFYWIKEMLLCDDYKDFDDYRSSFWARAFKVGWNNLQSKDTNVKGRAMEIFAALVDFDDELIHRTENNRWRTMERRGQRSEDELMDIFGALGDNPENFRAFLIADWEVRQRIWANDAFFKEASNACRRGKASQDIHSTRQAYEKHRDKLFQHFRTLDRDSTANNLIQEDIDKFCQYGLLLVTYDRILEERGGAPTHPPYGWDDASYGGNAQGTSTATETQ